MKFASMIAAVLTTLLLHAQVAVAQETPPPQPAAPTATPPSPVGSPVTPGAEASATPTPEPDAVPEEDNDVLDLEAIERQAKKESLNQKTNVASAATARLRDSPGVITVITREEIQRLAPKDLIDLLHLVAGFQFGAEVQGFVGPIFRGVYGQEGKVLVMWDGLEINETLYLTVALENHFPLSAIERIEIIRGPGSARYGGFAELAVINIIPRAGNVNGIEVTGTYGHQLTADGKVQLDFGRALGEVNYGQKFTGGLLDGGELSFTLFGGQTARSNRLYDDGFGSPAYRMNIDNASVGPTWVSTKFKLNGLELQFAGDALRIRQRDMYTGPDVLTDDGSYVPFTKPINNHHYSLFASAKYEFKIGDIGVITPKLFYKRSLPWYSGGDFLDYNTDSIELQKFMYYKTADRLRLTLLSAWTLLPGATLSIGADGTFDTASVRRNEEGGFDGLNGPFGCTDAVPGSGLECTPANDRASYIDVAPYGELSVLSDIANLTLGFRYEYIRGLQPAVNGETEPFTAQSFVPRFAVTKSFDQLWVKLLYSSAFKPPSIENISLNNVTAAISEYNARQDPSLPTTPRIVPESTTVYEAEAGYDFTDTTTITASLFRIEMQNPILFFVGADGSYQYNNRNRTGSQGAELEFKMLERWGALMFNYSYVTSDGLNDVPEYETGRAGRLRGVASSKLAFQGRFNITSNFNASVSGFILSERYGWLGGFNADGTSNVERTPAIGVVNVAMTYRDLFLEGLDGSVALQNALDSDYRILQAYNGNHMPLPMAGRELMARLTYRFGL
jgi:outer membrane receptor for ferrienterochelin and colicin